MRVCGGSTVRLARCAFEKGSRKEKVVGGSLNFPCPVKDLAQAAYVMPPFHCVGGSLGQRQPSKACEQTMRDAVCCIDIRWGSTTPRRKCRTKHVGAGPCARGGF